MGREPALALASTRALEEGHDAEWIEGLPVVFHGVNEESLEGTEAPPLRVKLSE